MTSACTRTTAVLASVRDDQLDAPTPCDELSLRELVAHVGTLGVAFAAAARKDLGELTDSPPGDGGYQLDDDWRATYPDNLAGLATAFRSADAWEGMTRIGGADRPADIAALVGLTEVVIHGWDVAVATGQDYDVEAEVAEAIHGHLVAFAADGPVEGLFGQAVELPHGATTFEQALALSGRAPGWRSANGG